LNAVKDWFKINERLSVATVFQHMDPNGHGDISTEDFKKGLEKLGISLRDREFDLLKKQLDVDNINMMHYQIFIREILGIPQKEFVPFALRKLTDIIEKRDLNENELLRLIDPNNDVTMKIDPLIRSFDDSKLGLSRKEVEEVVCFVTKIEEPKRLIGVPV
jgi:Ca2+-binding EF-hand superfamily protein